MKSNLMEMLITSVPIARLESFSSETKSTDEQISIPLPPTPRPPNSVNEVTGGRGSHKERKQERKKERGEITEFH